MGRGERGYDSGNVQSSGFYFAKNGACGILGRRRGPGFLPSSVGTRPQEIPLLPSPTSFRWRSKKKKNFAREGWFVQSNRGEPPLRGLNALAGGATHSSFVKSTHTKTADCVQYERAPGPHADCFLATVHYVVKPFVLRCFVTGPLSHKGRHTPPSAQTKTNGGGFFAHKVGDPVFSG